MKCAGRPRITVNSSCSSKFTATSFSAREILKYCTFFKLHISRILKCFKFIQADLLQDFCQPYWKTEMLAFKKWNILIITSRCEFIKHKWKLDIIYRTEIAKILGNAIKKRHFLRHLCRETFGIFPQNIAAVTILWHFLPSQNVMTRRNGSNPEDRKIFENWLDSITSLQWLFLFCWSANRKSQIWYCYKNPLTLQYYGHGKKMGCWSWCSNG